MMIRYIITVFCAVCATAGGCQTIYWQIKPKYRDITMFSESLYKVSTYSDMSLIDMDGVEIPKTKADSITYLTNGYALALKSADGAYQLKAIISKGGDVTEVNEELFVGDYPFFSEDMCPVYDSKGKYGYINTQGKLVIPCEYAAVHPFREGFASVSKKSGGFKGLLNKTANAFRGEDKVSYGPSTYIDVNNVPLRIQSEVGVPYIASSFRNGQALVQNKKGATFIIDRMGNIQSMNSEVDMRFNDYFQVIKDSEQRENLNTPFRCSYNTMYKIFMEKGKFGYRQYDKVIAPAQFDVASGVYLNAAIVKLEDKYGVIAFDANKTSCMVSESGENINVTAKLPRPLENQKITFARTVNGNERYTFAMDGDNDTRTLYKTVVKGNNPVYELMAENLVIWRSNETVHKDNTQSVTSGKDKTRQAVSVSAPAVVKANDKGVCVVNVRLANNSGTSQKISVSLSTGDSKVVTLGAGESTNVTMTATPVKDTRCTIKASCPAGSRTCTTMLKPLFIL